MISSSTNQHVKYIRSLASQRQTRIRERCFVLEGIRLISEALMSDVTLRLVLYSPNHLQATPEGQHLLHQLAHHPHCYQATPTALAAAASTITPQGVIAVARWPTPQPTPGLILVLDAIQDPGNVGTLLRSAAAAGAGRVLCMRGTADIYNPKVVRAAMGAHFHIAIQSDCTWDEVSSHFKDIPRIYATAVGDYIPYYDVPWHPPIALIVGNETHGVSSYARHIATRIITIPLADTTESLNAAVAGSIILFEARRQYSQLSQSQNYHLTRLSPRPIINGRSLQ